jgi:UDP-glucuronate 4-epimerase
VTAREPILITGADGLIGHAVVARLKSAGRATVAIDRSTADVRNVGVPSFEVEIGDIHKLHEIVDRLHIRSIVHCGAISGPMLGRDNPARLFSINVGGTIDVAECARQIAARDGSCRLVFCSSLAAYGGQSQDGIDESQPTLATGCYGASKAAAEKILQGYAGEHGVDAVSLRITWVYGPRRTTDCVIRTMIEDALAGRATWLSYGGGFRRQFVYVDDVAEAIVLALDADSLPQRVYNISGGDNPTLDEVGKIVAERFVGASITLEPGPDPADDRLGLLDISSARRDLGYVPKVGLAAGVARYAEWLRSRGCSTKGGDLA